ncbi:hypothetical protein B0H17DRAFT_1209363 [Mycena rosella]|uniref:Uncharacterized protein n=1 Tax=Mycena rosella TaxID=1033263 RepID=A0AAD7CYL0_MYCRO|nr:hypothetical protein B0H17DRAFT_1209363 [Mycena rosella]
MVYPRQHSTRRCALVPTLIIRERRAQPIARCSKIRSSPGTAWNRPYLRRARIQTPAGSPHWAQRLIDVSCPPASGARGAEEILLIPIAVFVPTRQTLFPRTRPGSVHLHPAAASSLDASIARPIPDFPFICRDGQDLGHLPSPLRYARASLPISLPRPETRDAST